MKNKKGQVGMIVGVAIAIIVGLILFQAIAANVDQGTRANSGAITKLNQTFTAPALNGIQELTGQELVSVIGVINATDGEQAVPSANYSIYECVKTSDNLKGICYKTTSAQFASKAVNVSYSYYPSGYIDDAGARSITGIIVLLTAIGIALVVLAGSKFDF